MYIRLSSKERKELISQLRVMAHPGISFYSLMLLSTLIAAYGLLANSTAVVIGAMLVAPLMGPIFGMTLALIIGDRKLFFEALLAEATGVALAVMIGVLVGSMPFTPSYSTEILSRTQPTLFDAIIALASGLAGGYVLVNPKLNAGIAGVAIATALVPPLAVCGLEIAAADISAAFSAMVLFITNFFAILLSAGLVFMLAGLERVHEPGPSRWLHLARTFGPGLVALAVLTFFLTNRLVDIVTRNQMEQGIRSELELRIMEMARGAELSELNIDHEGDSIKVEGVVLSWMVFDNTRVAELQQALENVTGHDVDLMVRTYSTHDYDAAGKFYWDDSELEKETRQQELRRMEEEMRAIRAGLQEYLRQLPSAFLGDVYRDPPNDNGHIAFTAEIETAKPISPQQVAAMEQVLAAVLEELHGEEQPVYLRVRQDSVRYADAQGYIYEAAAAEPPPGYVETKEMLFTALSGHLAEAVPGAVVEDLQHRRGPDLRIYDGAASTVPQPALIVQATVYSPELCSAEQILQSERVLEELTGGRVWLQFDNMIRALIDSTGVNSGFAEAPAAGH